MPALLRTWGNVCKFDAAVDVRVEMEVQVGFFWGMENGEKLENGETAVCFPEHRAERPGVGLGRPAFGK